MKVEVEGLEEGYRLPAPACCEELPEKTPQGQGFIHWQPGERASTPMPTHASVPVKTPQGQGFIHWQLG